MPKSEYNDLIFCSIYFNPVDSVMVSVTTTVKNPVTETAVLFAPPEIPVTRPPAQNPSWRGDLSKTLRLDFPIIRKTSSAVLYSDWLPAAVYSRILQLSRRMFWIK